MTTAAIARRLRNTNIVVPTAKLAGHERGRTPALFRMRVERLAEPAHELTRALIGLAGD